MCIRLINTNPVRLFLLGCSLENSVSFVYFPLIISKSCMGDIKLGKVDLGLHMVQSGKKRLCFDNQHSNLGDMTPVLKNVFRNVLHKQVIISLVERGNVFLDVLLYKPSGPVFRSLS